MRQPNFFQRFLLPGFVFQSVVIAGGYGTGRELVEFFLSYGPVGGLLAMLLISTVIWSVVSVVSFEFARVFRAFDYRTFFRELLGPAWILFELAYVATLLLVLAVIAATAGTILQEGLRLPYAFGVLAMMATVGFLVFRGSRAIEKFLAGWSLLLYVVYVVIFVWAFTRFGGEIRGALTEGDIQSGWWLGGIRYAGYNLAVIAAVLFTLRHATSRRDAVVSGVLAGPIAIIPGLLFYLSIIGSYPEVLGEAVPATFLLGLLGSPALSLVFQIVLFGTLIETGTGMIHSVNERIAHHAEERLVNLPKFWRPGAAIVFLGVAAIMSRFGLMDLIANGYGNITWAFIAVYVVPILTVGVWKVAKGGRAVRRSVGWSVGG